MSTEVITTTDKATRDRMFDDLRANGNELEKQVVKFSSNEPVLFDDGTQKETFVQYEAIGKGGKTIYGKNQRRPVYRNNWSVAYPTGVATL